MLLRLILVLMLALGAPAMPAAAHDGMQPTAMGEHHMSGMDHRGDQTPMPEQHLCIGCVPVGNWGAARVSPPILLPAPAPVAHVATLRVLPGQAPTPPPPRIA